MPVTPILVGLDINMGRLRQGKKKFANLGPLAA